MKCFLPLRGQDVAPAFIRRKSLDEIIGFLLDARFEALLPNSKVSERVQSKSPLLLPRVAVRYNQTFVDSTQQH